MFVAVVGVCECAARAAAAAAEEAIVAVVGESVAAVVVIVVVAVLYEGVSAAWGDLCGGCPAG